MISLFKGIFGNKETKKEIPDFSTPPRSILSPRRSPKNKKTGDFSYRVVKKRPSITPESIKFDLDDIESTNVVSDRDINNKIEDLDFSLSFDNETSSQKNIAENEQNLSKIVKIAAVQALQQVSKKVPGLKTVTDSISMDFFQSFDVWNKKYGKKTNKNQNSSTSLKMIIESSSDYLSKLESETERWKKGDPLIGNMENFDFELPIYEPTVVDSSKIEEIIIELDKMQTKLQLIGSKREHILEKTEKITTLLNEASEFEVDLMSVVCSTENTEY